MSGQDILLPLTNGLAFSSVLFISASGLTMVYGILRIVNFSHTAFLMLGAFLAFTISRGATIPLVYFLLLIVGVGILVGLLGAFIEVFILRRIYENAHLYSFVTTFAILLIIEGGIQLIWGVNPLSVEYPEGWDTALRVSDIFLPKYSILVMVAGPVLALGLWFFLGATSAGRTIRAAADDMLMTDALGYKVPWIYTGVFSLGVFLAGVAGGIMAPFTALTPDMGIKTIIEAFAVVIVGGIGRIGGAALAALILGVADSFLTVYVPVLTGITFFVAMAVVLLIRPKGLVEGRVVQ